MLLRTYSSDRKAPAAITSLPLPTQSKGPAPKRRGLSLSCESDPAVADIGSVVAGALSKRCAVRRDEISIRCQQGSELIGARPQQN